MGRRRRSWRTLKKFFSCQSEENSRKREIRWLEKKSSPDSDPRRPDNSAAVEVNPPTEEDVKLIEAENEQNRQAYSVALATAAAAEAAVAAAQAAAEVVRLTQSLGSKTKEEMAAVKIQTAFRGYMARRALRALRGLIRLKTLVGGQSAKRQAASTSKRMQTLCRMQYEVRTRRRRMQEHSLSLRRQIQQKQRKEKSQESIGENWDDSILSNDQIEVSLRHRQEAGMRRERALAYAYSHRQASNPAGQTFMDPNNPRCGWMWSERWMPTEETTNRCVSTKGDDLSNKTAQSLTTRQSPSTPKSTKRVKPMMRQPSPRATNDSNSINSGQSERCHRYSVASSSMRDDESLYSCPPAVRNYMASTESTRAKSRLSSPMGGSERRVGTPESRVSASAKKRLSFSGTPAGLRRHSGPPRIEAGFGKDSDEKVV